MQRLIVMGLLIAAATGGGHGAERAAAPTVGTAGRGAGLRVYLPREVMIDGAQITFGQIALCQGEAPLCAKAQAVEIAKFSVTGQQIVLDRKAILSRLAACGIDTDDVTLTGAEQVVVRRNETMIGSERFLAVARGFLEAQTQSAPPHTIRVIQTPTPWALPADAGNVELRPHPTAYRVNGTYRVRVDIVQDGRVLGHRDVAFALRYQRLQTVATVDLSPGDVLTMENTKIVSVETDRPPTTGWRAPFGQIVRRPIRAGQAIPETLLTEPEPPVLVRQRQMVVVRLETPALVVSWVGEALNEGRLGALIKVRMGTGRTGRIITGRVQSDGTVEPYHEGLKR